MAQKIALLGGGQLGKMFLQEAVNFPHPVAVLDPDPNAPCAHLTGEFVCGNFNDKQTVIDFVHQSGATVVAIEIEHVNVEALETLAAEGIKVMPAPAVLQLIQDKGKQKQFYQQHHLASAPFYLIEKKEEIDTNLIPFPFVQKLRTGGYDGKGVQVIHGHADLDKIWDAPSVIEAMCLINKEIAVVVAADESGHCEAFPLMEMVFDDALNLVDYVQMPAQIPPEQAAQAEKLALDVVRAFGSAGIFAVELFVSKTGDIWINETAPRVHNSAHVTIEACNFSQFAQMWRLLAGMPLGKIHQYRPAAMINLIGSDGHHGKAQLLGLAEALNLGDVFPHWYGKTETRAGRKMGHVTILNDDWRALSEQATQLKKYLTVVSQPK